MNRVGSNCGSKPKKRLMNFVKYGYVENICRDGGNKKYGMKTC